MDTTETLIFENDFEICDKVRNEIQVKFDNIWIFLYKGQEKQKSSLTVTTSTGQKLEKERVSELIVFSKTFRNKIKTLKQLTK